MASPTKAADSAAANSPSTTYAHRLASRAAASSSPLTDAHHGMSASAGAPCDATRRQPACCYPQLVGQVASAHRNTGYNPGWYVEGGAMRWTVLIVRLPADPSRHRVAVWRELRRVGALSLGQGVWAVPATPVFTAGLDRAVKLAERGDGEVVLLDAAGRDET